MEEKKTQKERIQWHPGFFAGIQIELEEDAENPLYDSVMNLIVLLSKSGRMDDIVKAAQDKAYQNKLFKEFDL